MRGQRVKAKDSKIRPTAGVRYQTADDGKKGLIVCCLLLLLVSIVFGQTVRHEFINYDDDQYVTENPHVQNGLNWPDVIWAFSTGHTGYAHPVTWLTLQFDYQLYGMWAGGHHLTSVIIHAVNCLLLFFLFWRLTRSLWPSAFVAAIFAIHPLHVESVAWVAERKDVLSGLFFLLTLHAYVGYAIRPKMWRYGLGLCFFILGILSKPMLVTVPCLLLLLDYWPLRRLTLGERQPGPTNSSNLGRLILEKIPFAAVAAGWSVLTFIIQKQVGAVVAEAHIDIGRRIANALVSYATYVWKTVWPSDLALFYPYPTTIPAVAVVISAIFLLLVSIVCFVKRQSSPYLFTGWFWYIGMLVPVIGFIQVGNQARADRYTYLPQIGLCIVVTWCAIALFGKWRRSREILAGLAVIVIAGLTAVSHIQASIWKNNETVWLHSLAHTSDNYVAHNNLGKALLLKGRLDDAIVHFRHALEICDECSDVYNNLGHTLARAGKWPEAIDAYRAAIRTGPKHPNPHNNNNLGIALAKAGKTDEAIEEFREALRIDGDYREAHCNLALVLVQTGQRDEAIAHLREALRLKPDDPQVKAQLRQLGVEM